MNEINLLASPEVFSAIEDSSSFDFPPPSALLMTSSASEATVATIVADLIDQQS